MPKTRKGGRREGIFPISTTEKKDIAKAETLILKEGRQMGMVKDSLFDVLEVALASLERIGRAWERGDREMLERMCKILGEFGETRDWENIEALLWLTQKLREVLGRG